MLIDLAVPILGFSWQGAYRTLVNFTQSVCTGLTES